MAYDDLGDSDKALADFNKALELSITYADAFNNRGKVYRKQNKVPEAMSDYRRAADSERISLNLITIWASSWKSKKE